MAWKVWYEEDGGAAKLLVEWFKRPLIFAIYYWRCVYMHA